MDDIATRVHLLRYTNRGRIEQEIAALMDELFTLEFQDTTLMDEDSLEVRRRKIKYVTDTIEKQQELLAKIPLPAPKPAPVVKKEEMPLSFVIAWIFAVVIAGLFYLVKIRVDELRELKELTKSQQMVNWQHLAKIKMLEEQLAALTGEHIGLEEEHKVLEVHDALVTIDRDKLKKENAIAWRWYDRHTAKIDKLEEEINTLTAAASSSVTFEGVEVPMAYCVALADSQRKTVKCHSNKTSSDYIIHFGLLPDIRKNDVLKIDNKLKLVHVVGKDHTYRIDKSFKYFNDDDPYERVDIIQ